MNLSTLARIEHAAEEVGVQILNFSGSDLVPALAYVVLTDEGGAEMRRDFAELQAKELLASPLVRHLTGLRASRERRTYLAEKTDRFGASRKLRVYPAERVDRWFIAPWKRLIYLT